MPAVVVKPPTVLRDFEADAATILEGMGMHLARDGRWKHFRPERLKDLTWGDVRRFLEANYPEKCPREGCKTPGHPDRFEEWRVILDGARKQANEQRSAGTLYKGAAMVGHAMVPIKLFNALKNDFPQEFGGIDGDYASPTDFLKSLEGCSSLTCFVINPTRSHGR